MRQPGATLPLEVAAALCGVPMVRLGRWCATARLRCNGDGDGWRIPVVEEPSVANLAREYGSPRAHVPALAVPVPEARPDLATRAAARLSLTGGAVTVTPLALDGGDYVVAVWRGDVQNHGRLLALEELAVELDAELLEGELGAD